MGNGPSAEKYLLVTSTGPAAEYQGSAIGLYREAGTHNGASYYVQLHDVNTEEEPGKIYKYKDGGWRAGDVLGGAVCGLKNSSATATVPESGWQYVGEGGWPHDAGDISSVYLYCRHRFILRMITKHQNIKFTFQTHVGL